MKNRPPKRLPLSEVASEYTCEPPEGWEEHDRRVRAERQRQADDETRRRELARRARLHSWGVPRKDIELICSERLRETRALAVAKSHASTRIVVISGAPGCGKTTSGGWWIEQPGPVFEYGGPLEPVFMDVSRLERVSRYKASDMERVERARRLVIDDLGQEYADRKNHFVSLLNNVVNARYADEVLTLVTTNLTAGEFKARYGERLADRIREVGHFEEIGEGSLREQHA